MSHLSLAVGLIIGAAATPMAAGGSATLAFAARDVTGKEHPAAEKNARATVWLFIAHDCPISNSYAPDIGRIMADYGQRGITVNLVYSESDFTVAALAEHAREHNYQGALFLDADARVARSCGLTVIPAAAVIDPHGQLAYCGRIDDRYVRIGHERSVVTTHDLRDALDAVLAGRPVATPRTEAVGCAIAAGG
jgi:hypothetical protein